MSGRAQGYLFLALAMILVGSTVVASKLIAAGLAPFTATALRFAVAFPLFLAIMRLAGTRLPPIGRRDGTLLVIQAGAGSVGYTTLLITGLQFTSAANAGIVIGTLPLVSAAIAILLLGERPRPSLLLAIALAASGVLAITLNGDGAGSASWIGTVLVLGAVLCEGLFILLNKRLRVPVPPLALSTLMSGLGLAVALPPALLEAPWRDEIAADAVLATLYYALVPTIGGFLLWYAGAARVTGSEAALFTALAPVAAVAMAVLLLGEPVGLGQLIGIACVLAAVVGFALARAAPPDRRGRR